MTLPSFYRDSSAESSGTPAEYPALSFGTTEPKTGTIKGANVLQTRRARHQRICVGDSKMPEQSSTRLCACGCGKPARAGRLFRKRHSAAQPWKPAPSCPECGSLLGAWRQNHCRNEFHAESRDRARATARQWLGRLYAADPSFRVVANARSTAWRAANLERNRIADRAGKKVMRAIKHGVLTRPSICEQCGDTTRRIEAAHADYSRPLDVRWLCKPCHGRWDHAEPKTLHQTSANAPTVSVVTPL